MYPPTTSKDSVWVAVVRALYKVTVARHEWQFIDARHGEYATEDV